MSTPSGGTPPLRIGNQEREAASTALDAHLEAGRLDAEEYGERYAKATMASTREDLDVLFLDLPAPHPFPPVSMTKDTGWAPSRARDWQRHIPDSAIGRVATALVLVALVSLVLPIVAAGAIVWFVIIPMLARSGCGSRRRERSWSAATWR